ncbi:hypothetical protein X471_00809 [Bartonella bacilliformis str. Heidi Mejia]|uniref:ThiE/TenI family protein n=2 Tax=Bartonella bacilliformis TaxID=774 RepID=A1UR90_BARBK|nr:thiamine phosphate synthase [Bartonella bacilliformis]ABM44921.1 ThiE/TenI family protein [Bartonella bacilliformis KC583]AMG85376.1 thiamine phosphate synthase [Bartonella bacilliformis]EKS46045.1 thiamine-phosphate pyrophosphorylase [Bartonella bacilliformis INS]EYS89105.1 hypothetical protein X472_00805 [Bartonella bacilliformis San Pedro600-02]EYS91211.1 hypothetical protein X471_00809 [Bartonella bacilliformis str. Heidi Mejia]
MTKQKSKPIESCLYPQLVLTVDVRRTLNPSLLRTLLQTQSFTCVIIYDSLIHQGDENFLQNKAQSYVDDVQHSGAALIIADHSQIVGRIKADGLHVEGNREALKIFKDQTKENKIVGFGNLRDRHSAMTVAEAGVDYLFFGKLGADQKAQAHPRNLSLATWWAEIMEIPAIIQAGNDYATVDEAFKTACEFIAVEDMLLSHEDPLPLLQEMVKKCKKFPLLMGKA